MINIEEFKKIELKLGKILNVEKVPDTDKLLKLTVDLGEENPRTIVSGIAEYFPEENTLINKKVMFVANLEPRVIKGIESQGMILALSSEEGGFSLLIPESDLPSGTKAR